MMPDNILPPSDRQPCPLFDAVEPFLRQLGTAGYADRTLRNKRTVARAFVRWLKRRRVAPAEVIEAHLTAFVHRKPHRQTTRDFELGTLRQFLSYLRTVGKVPLPPQSSVAAPAGDLEQRYLHYLRQDRGLAANSLRLYLPFVRAFLRAQAVRPQSAPPGAWTAGSVQDFLLTASQRRSSEHVRLLAAALRSFLRFCYLRGDTALDLSQTVPGVRRWTPAAVPVSLAPTEIARVLAATDRATRRGRRDHAILLLLARLGLRAGEIVTLELGDLRWRSGELLIRGKGGVRARLPLLAEVGEALARYLRRDRGPSPSRRVFLRLMAPRSGLAGPGAVTHLVRRALARAGVTPRSRGAAHLFRHSLATTMLQHGASLAAIGDVLRHRAPRSTARYAHVAVEALRGVARPWPGGGAQ
jgi:site-specific recombinase XerD